MRATRRSRRSDPGSAAAEIVILTPLLVLFALVLLLGGRLVNTQLQVGDAARAAVESAAISSTASVAQARASAAASYEISRDGLRCGPYSMTSDVAQFTAGGYVSVQIQCGVKLVSLGLAGLPGSVTLSSHAGAGIELYREVG
ncbi:MAG TPA: TadE/TadG family type IV pilus assembly protein [Acidimicrobiales bacterium]|nr:TadE/TadG family type IV pilus assembly protein [Acidimicrobiales bacterium]